MENNTTISKAREALEAHVQLIIRKGVNMTPPDIDVLTKDLCALETLKRIESNGYSENSFRNRGSYSERYHDSETSGRRYNDSGNSNRYYDSNSGYSGHSIQDRMIDQLERMFDEAQSEHERQTVQTWINRLRN